jgi:uncharacterized Fe-S cluster-containing radical SAM superfamily protein
MYIITSGLNPNEDHICHYGVKGMRWGEHLFKSVANYKKKKYSKLHEKAYVNFRKAHTFKNLGAEEAAEYHRTVAKSANRKYNEYGLKLATKAYNDAVTKHQVKSALAEGYKSRGDIKNYKKYIQEAKEIEKQAWMDRATIEQVRQSGGEAYLGRDYVAELLERQIYA